jgi:hypothetical protein
MNATHIGGRLLSLQAVIESCLASANACDQRKGHDLSHLLAMQTGLWSGRFVVEGLFGLPSLALAVLCRLRVNGLVWEDGGPRPHEVFRLVLLISHNYPLLVPGARFVDEVPYCPHVVHGSFLPDTAGIPSELQTYIRMGQGNCCFLRTAQWSSDLSCNLALVVWQISRILTFDKVFGEAGSLNASARDFAIRLRETGTAPLGSPLPHPDRSHGLGLDAARAWDENGQSGCDNDIEWVQDENRRP